MALFHYKKIDSNGKTIEGDLEAKDKFALYHNIKLDGSTVVFAEEIKENPGLSFLRFLPFIGNVKMRDKIVFAKNLSKMIDAGLPITRCLSIMERQAKGKLKKVLAGLNNSIST